jgi:hypothetical protein
LRLPLVSFAVAELPIIDPPLLLLQVSVALASSSPMLLLLL